jgi:flagellar biosynthetic protein FliR
LSVFLALAIFPTLETHQVLVQEGAGNLLWWTLRECIVGILVGFVGYFLFAFVEFGAEIINREIGLNAMPIIDPGSGEYTTELTQVIVMTFSVMFLVVGGHVYLYHAIQQSFIFIPLGGLHYDAQGMAVAATALVAESIMYGFRLAAPVFVCMLLMGIALGFMSRIMPQMNVWIISVPLKVFVGIGTLIASLPLMYQLFGLVFERCYQYLHAILKMNGS